ncbi:serine/threonine protein kinase [Actinomadura logoneensis]|uniref:non-specific serine/threonine protein kinase n=1 Tax=Actinomadura logoneensis TaxID=2293572 RepID=A0A372JC27_9ACTN|nr:serine/threonine-protein kinase [Actinomadura logoneensis]RFU37563.1 serine/threonine protein kinase [Actinomadura logoneensis]
MSVSRAAAPPGFHRRRRIGGMAHTVVDGWTVPGFTHERDLGGGPAGRVVLAVDDMTQTKVAIRYLDKRLESDEALLSRYRMVARRLSQLEDPNVVDLFDFVENPSPSGGTAIVMERAEGVSLRRILASRGPAGPLAALSALGGVLLGLAAGEGREVVHGALRPSNVMVAPDGEARLTDFGLGFGPTAGPAYAAPELWEGAPPSVASDLYAAAAVFFECLTGRPPFSARGNSGWAKAHRETPVPVDQVPGPLRDVLAHGLAKEPEKRPASAADFAAELEEAAVAAYGPSWEAQGRGRLAELVKEAAAAPEPAPSRIRITGQNRVSAPSGGRGGGGGRRWALVGLATVVVVGGGAGAYFTMGGKKETADPPHPSQVATTAPTAQPSAPKGPGTALAAQIREATGRTPAASFSFRRTGPGGNVTAHGTFTLVNGAEPSYAMQLSGSGETKRLGRAIVIGGNAYVRAGKVWRQVPVTAKGYPALAAQIRSAGSVSALTAMLENAARLQHTGTLYQGTAPLGVLGGQPGFGGLYADLARTSGAQDITFYLRVDKMNRPLQLKLRAGAKPHWLLTNYTDWARKPPIAAPKTSA